MILKKCCIGFQLWVVRVAININAPPRPLRSYTHTFVLLATSMQQHLTLREFLLELSTSPPG
jgi:hypothetical protein